MIFILLNIVVLTRAVALVDIIAIGVGELELDTSEVKVIVRPLLVSFVNCANLK